MEQIRENKYFSLDESAVSEANESFSSQNFVWSINPESKGTIIHKIDSPSGLKIDIPDNATELDFFQLFFDNEILKILVNETNRYESQNRKPESEIENSAKRSHHIKWSGTAVPEIMCFLAITLLCGHVEKD